MVEHGRSYLRGKYVCRIKVRSALSAEKYLWIDKQQMIKLVVLEKCVKTEIAVK